MIARDRIARIIDPEAFANWRRYRAIRAREDKLAPADATRAADYQYGEDILKAYRKADKIIARHAIEQQSRPNDPPDGWMADGSWKP